MRYVMGISKAYYSSKGQKYKTRNRKYYFSYEFVMESCKFRRVRISTIKAIYYKITFIFGLKAKKVTNVYCKDCRKHYDCIVNFWDKNLDCPNC